MKIYRIVLTGGPCAGKTTYLNSIKESFKKNNIPCLIVPEAATILINKGFDPGNWTPMEFQKMVLERELFDERENTEFINKKQHKYDSLVIVYDRGIYDNAAYLNNWHDFGDLLIDYDLDGMQVLDGYDLVLDLLSMATCKPSAYTTKNNEARKEDLEFAKRLDKRTSNAWANHRNIRIISGNCSIEEEEEKILNHVYDFLNGKNVIETQKFLVDTKNSNFSKIDKNNRMSVIDTYLKANNGEIMYKISQRNHFGTSYILDTYTYNDGKKTIISSKIISKDVYNTLYNTFEHSRQDRGDVYSFVDNETLYRLCCYFDKTILEVQKNDFSDIIIPDYIKVFGKYDENDLDSPLTRKLKK